MIPYLSKLPFTNRNLRFCYDAPHRTIFTTCSNEPRHEKTGFLHYENKDADQLRGKTAKLISAFVFTTRIVQSLYFLNPNFQASGHLLWMFSPVCNGPGRKPRRPVFSQRGSNVSGSLMNIFNLKPNPKKRQCSLCPSWLIYIYFCF